jgi:glutaredoxin-related protein
MLDLRSPFFFRFADGELVGGLDVVKEMAASGELQSMIPAGHILGKDNAEEELNERLRKLVKEKRIMLFMKVRTRGCECA